jgi:hypothetical protein
VRRKLKKKRESRACRPTTEARLAGLGPLLPVGAVLAVVLVTIGGLEWLRSEVLSVPEFNPPLKLQLEYLPGAEWVEEEGWLPRIAASIKVPAESQLMSPDLLGSLASQIAASGWVRSVERVTRETDGTVRVYCDYRRPIAMVLTNRGKYIPIDKDGVRLPEEYPEVETDSGWMRILGVQSDPPLVGQAYGMKDEDAVAAVRLALVLFSQQEIADKISGIDVSNYNGRENKYKTHIALWTRDQRRVDWGSAIGREVEEPELAYKLRNLVLWLKSNSPQAYADLTTYRNGVLAPVGH